MTIDAILAQLASMKDNAQSFIGPSHSGTEPEYQDIWRADIAACEVATDILSVLQDAGINDPEQLRDLFRKHRPP